MTSDLKGALKDKFGSTELDEKELQKLEKKISASRASHQSTSRKNFVAPYWPAVAIFLIFGFLVMFSYDAYKMFRGKMLISAIVSETVHNHIKLKPLEVKNTRIDAVLDYFTMLEFNPIKSSKFVPQDGYQLLGGRYCSIMGADAAQLRLRSPNGRVVSWYLGMLSPSDLKLLPDLRKGQMPISRSMKGLQTRLWQEGGVVFVEVRGMPEG